MSHQPPHLRRMKLHRWFEEHVQWPLLDVRDWILRRDRSRPLYGSPTLGMRVRTKALDSLPGRTPTFRAPAFVSQHRAGFLAFLALPLAAVAVVAVIAGGSGNDGSSPSSSALAKAPVRAPAQVQVKGVEASSADQEAQARQRAAKRRERAAARRQAAADRRRAATARQHAADRKRARQARARRAARSTPAPASTPAATPVSSPSPPAASSPPPRPSTPSRPPSRPPASHGGGNSSPPQGVKFDDAG